MSHRSILDEHDLQIAAAIQQALLPTQCPHCPHGRMAAGHRMVREVGGDFYDFPFAGDGKTAILIGDVMGHGVSAGLLMAMIVGLLRRDARRHTDPLSAARLVNDHLINIEQQVGHAVTCSLFYAVLDMESRRFEYVNAGHPPPVVCNRELCLISGLSATCPVLGAIESSEVDKAVHTFTDEERIVLYTDGVTEACNPRGDAFGRTRLHQVASENVRLKPVELLSEIFRALDAFAEGCPADDDQSVVIVDFEEDDA